MIHASADDKSETICNVSAACLKSTLHSLIRNAMQMRG